MFWKFYGKLKFYVCRQNGSQTGKNYAYSKVTALMIIYERSLLLFLEEQVAMRNNKS